MVSSRSAGEARCGSLALTTLVLVASAALAADATRICQTPDCLRVENIHSKDGLVKSIGILDTRLHLYIYVPPATQSFTLGIFDQQDDVPGAGPSSFVLYAPDGSEVQTLNAGQAKAWADYPIATNGHWGVWRLSVSGPQDPTAEKGGKAAGAVNYFMARTQGEVDLYLKPEPMARVRGIRLNEPQFGGSATHTFTVQPPGASRVRFNLLRSSEAGATRLDYGTATAQRSVLGKDDRLAAGLTLESDEYSALDPATALPLQLSNVRGSYGLGVEQELRLFCTANPLMPALRKVMLRTTDAAGHGVAARVDITPPQTANETQTVYTAPDGSGVCWELPGVTAQARVTRGYEFEPQNLDIPPGAGVLNVTLPARLKVWPGWYGGDDHCHTSYYDGTDTPAEMVEAARAAGLSWQVLSEHGHSENIERTEKANAEALAVPAVPGFTLIPGMEYTGLRYHANILGAMVRVPADSSLEAIVTAAKAADSEAAPVAMKLNHPSLGKTAADEARNTPDVSMLELWNSAEPEGTRLWWELLNAGRRVFSDTASDSHNRKNLEPGSRRTYVYLGEQPATAANIIRALRSGQSFLSQGAIVDFRLNDQRPGATIKNGPLNATLAVQSARPMEKVELIHNGAVLQSWPAPNKTSLDQKLTLPAASGWYIVRVLGAGRDNALAMTNPIWVEK